MDDGVMVRGVALLLVLSLEKLWTLKELQSKPQLGKQAGDWSIPMETLNPGEQDIPGLERLLNEEVGVGVRIDPKSRFVFLQEIDIIGAAKLRVYVAHFVSADAMIVPVSSQMEVKEIGWRRPEEILLQRHRVGVREALDAFREYQNELRMQQVKLRNVSYV